MPWLQQMGTEASTQTTSANIGDTQTRVAALAPTATFTDFVAAVLDRALETAEEAYLNAWPPGLLATIQAAVADAITRGVPVQVQWAPAYDYEVHVWEALAGATSGGLILNLRSPYP
jgi:hypothetical protein